MLACVQSINYPLHWKATVIIATLDYIYYNNIQGTDEVTRGHAISSESAGSESREK